MRVVTVAVHRSGRGIGTFFSIDHDNESIEQSRLNSDFAGKMRQSPTCEYHVGTEHYTSPRFLRTYHSAVIKQTKTESNHQLSHKVMT